MVAALASDWIFNFSSATTEQNSMNIDIEYELNVPQQICVFVADRKTKTALASDWLTHFQFLHCNCWTEFTKLDRKHILNLLYQVCFFFVRWENQNSHPGLIGRYIFNFYHMFLGLWSEISLFHKLIYDIAQGSILIG